MKVNKLALYIKKARVTAEASPDSETQVGSILISKDTQSAISEGYNGFMRGADDEHLPKTRPAKYEVMIHAEKNLIYNAARNGVRTSNCFIVQTHSPCIDCARALYQSGIDLVYFEIKHGCLDDLMKAPDMQITCEPIDKYFKLTIKPNRGVSGN